MDIIYDNHGDAATFTPNAGDDVTCTVIVETDNSFFPSGTVQIADPQITISYRREEIDRKVKRGEIFTVGSNTYKVVSMAQYPGSWNEFEGRAVVEDTTVTE